MSHVFKVGDGQSFRIKEDFYKLLGTESLAVQRSLYDLKNGDFIWSGALSEDGKSVNDGWTNTLSSDHKTITMKNDDIALFNDKMTENVKMGADTARWVVFAKSARQEDYIFLGVFKYADGSPADGKLILNRMSEKYPT